MNSLTHCHVTSQVNAYTDDYTPPVEGLFDECSPLADIYKELMIEHEVAASIFAAALFNNHKGETATHLAQDSNFKVWVYDFFEYLQNEKPAPFTKPNLEFLNLRGA